MLRWSFHRRPRYNICTHACPNPPPLFNIDTKGSQRAGQQLKRGCRSLARPQQRGTAATNPHQHLSLLAHYVSAFLLPSCITEQQRIASPRHSHPPVVHQLQYALADMHATSRPDHTILQATRLAATTDGPAEANGPSQLPHPSAFPKTEPNYRPSDLAARNAHQQAVEPARAGGCASQAASQAGRSAGGRCVLARSLAE